MGIGIGSIMAEVAYLMNEKKYVIINELIKSLKNRFNIDDKETKGAIEMAKICGVINIIDNKVYLLKR